MGSYFGLLTLVAGNILAVAIAAMMIMDVVLQYLAGFLRFRPGFLVPSG
jgi:hypothetical protein